MAAKLGMLGSPRSAICLTVLLLYLVQASVRVAICEESIVSAVIFLSLLTGLEFVSIEHWYREHPSTYRLMILHRL